MKIIEDLSWSKNRTVYWMVGETKKKGEYEQTKIRQGYETGKRNSPVRDNN